MYGYKHRGDLVCDGVGYFDIDVTGPDARHICTVAWAETKVTVHAAMQCVPTASKRVTVGTHLHLDLVLGDACV